MLQAAAAALAADSTLTPAQVGNLAAQAAVAAGQGVLTQDSEDVVMSCSRIHCCKPCLKEQLQQVATSAAVAAAANAAAAAGLSTQEQVAAAGAAAASVVGDIFNGTRACVACLADE